MGRISAAFYEFPKISPDSKNLLNGILVIYPVGGSESLLRRRLYSSVNPMQNVLLHNGIRV